MYRGAEFSPCGKYRYNLRRVWEPALPCVAFVMLNPSTANAENDDPTIRKCIGFAERWGYGGFDVVNLFAWRSTQPDVLLDVPDPVGPDNPRYLAEAMKCSAKLICGWGKHGTLKNIDRVVVDWMRRTFPEKAHALAVNKDGTPQHPLYVSYDVPVLGSDLVTMRLPVPYQGRPA